MSALSTRDRPRRVTVMQGDTRVSAEADVVFTTLLGSCIAACLHDPVVKVGGINHFLLAEPGADTDIHSLQRYGVFAMEVLINAMLELGAKRHQLRARLYGGASLRDGLHDIGAANAVFARGFLRDERIALVGEDVGGFDARRVEFRPAAGLARCRAVAGRPPSEGLTGSRTLPADVEFF